MRTFAPRVLVVGAYGIVCRVHADEARRMVTARQAFPAHSGKRISEIRLPSVPTTSDAGLPGGNSNRQHRIDICDGGQMLVIETETTLPRVVTTKSCRVMSLKHSSRVLGEVLSAERVGLWA